MDYEANAGPRSTAPRLPFKESLSSLNEKLERLHKKVGNFQDHLFPTPQPAESARSIEAAPPIDFSEMFARAHEFVDRIEKRFDTIRDRF